MPVFLSHRTADTTKAQEIANRLLMRDVPCYMAHFDPDAKTTAEITGLLVGRIETCTHLLALVTDATHGSWWVPFEIGVARHADKRIASFDFSVRALPEFLTEWPVLSGMAAVDTFANLYHKDRVARPLQSKYASWDQTISSADQFHRELKAALRF